MRVVNLQEMKDIENVASEEFGFTEDLIIENVGVRGADFLIETFLAEKDYGEVVFLIGPGNNGGDGLAIARNLANSGIRSRCFLFWSLEEMSEHARAQLNLAEKFGVKITPINASEELDSYLTQTQDEYFIVDAIIGTGFRAPLSNFLFDVVETANRHANVMVSLDIPTGISGETGEMGSTAIEADITLSIGLPKVGQYVGEGPVYSGELYNLEVGFPAKVLEGGDKKLLNRETIQGISKDRDKFGHKFNYGHSLIVGGSKGLTGALMMASTAALRVGTGLVTSATWKENYAELASRITPEIMTGVIPKSEEDLEEVLKDLDRYSSIVVGPGLGRTEEARWVTLNILNNFSGPVVIDADAIKVLSLKEDASILANRNGATILTPHIGEFSHFIGQDKQKVLANPIGYVQELVDQINCSVILKGPCSFLGFPNGEIYINYFPNDGMATGGSGDVLAGILGGLLAQYKILKKSSTMFENKSRIYQAVCLSVSAHTLAGKFAADKVGVRAMSAGSIIECLGDAFAEMKSWD